MSPAVQAIDAQQSIQEAADQMRRAGVGCLVVRSCGRPIGVVTDRDIVTRSVARGHGPTAPVREATTCQPITCFGDETLEQAVDHMVRGGVRRLLVLDREQSVVGILSLDDIAVAAPDGHLAGIILARTVEKRRIEVDQRPG